MIIDEKGKLFGKINIVDLLAILFFVGLTPIFYYGYKIFNIPVPIISSIEPDNGLNERDIRVTITGEFFNDKTRVKVGDEFLTNYIISKNKITGTVPKNISAGLLDVTVINPGNLYGVLKKGFISATPAPVATLNVDIVAETIVNLEFRNIDKDIAELINVGDKSEGSYVETNVEILEILSYGTATYRIDIGIGNVIIKEEDNKKEMLCKVKIVGEVKNDKLYFRGKQIGLGGMVEFNSGKYALHGKVIPDIKGVSVVVRFHSVLPEVAALIKEGDIVGADFYGRFPVLKTIRKIDDDVYTVFSQLNTKNISVTRGDLRLIELELEFPVMSKANGGIYFKNELIAIGQSVGCRTNNYIINGKIIAIKK